MENKVNKVLLELSGAEDIDFYLFSATVSRKNADELIVMIRNHENKKSKCGLILTTNGGDPDDGYRIIKAIKRNYKSLSLYVFGSCKSTGTLLALGADEIIMNDFGEFGPLDIQIMKEDELLNISTLNYFQSLISLNEQLLSSFESIFLSLKRRSGYNITTKTAAEIASKLAIGLISPISEQLDPVKLGEIQRSIKIAEAYGQRVCDNSNVIKNLISKYPCHSFVIDFEEAQSLFQNVRWVTEVENEIAVEWFGILRTENDSKDLIHDLSKFYNPVKEKSETEENVSKEGESTNHETSVEEKS